MRWAAVAVLILGCGGDSDSGDPDAAASDDAAATIDAGLGAGRWTLTWALEAGGSPITCTEAGAATISVLSSPSGGGSGFDDLFDCNAATGTSGLIPAGDWSIRVRILDTGDNVLAAFLPRAISIDTDGQVVDLGNFVFVFPEDSNLLFVVDFGDVGGSNCVGGAGGEIVEDQGTTLTLSGGGACISLELLADGVLEASDICAEIPSCIERSVIQTLVSLPPGVYELELEGIFDNAGTLVTCFRSIDIFEITAGPVDLGVVVVPYDPTDDPTFCATI